MRMEKVLLKELRSRYPAYTAGQKEQIQAMFEKALDSFKSQVVVLDDDPTGTQTVHDIYVYTEMTEGAIREGFEDENGMFYILTNSRSFSEKKTEEVHRGIAKSLLTVSREKEKEFLLISRGDSTLRGHYPLETDVLKSTLEAGGYPKMDGLVLCPFFPEGGRFTAEDIHYCLDGVELVPAGQTEFAGDATFGFSSSDLKEYVEEKSHGAYPASEVLSISLSMLRGLEHEKITGLLMEASGFRQIVVNALDYEDLEVFAVSLMEAISRGKHFLIRSAAGMPRIMGGISARDFLSREELLGAAAPEQGADSAVQSAATQGADSVGQSAVAQGAASAVQSAATQGAGSVGQSAVAQGADSVGQSAVAQGAGSAGQSPAAQGTEPASPCAFARGADSADASASKRPARGGLIVVGSHVKKTNQQLEKLREVPGVVFLEFSTEHAAEPGALNKETERAVAAVERVIREGRTAVLHTSRKLVLPEGGSPEEALRISVEISLALTDVVAALSVEPAFILAKGGITSSDTAVRGLGIKKALVMGQADKGIPVWKQGPEAKFPGRPYIVFPGNVGTEDTLANLAGSRLLVGHCR